MSTKACFREGKPAKSVFVSHAERYILVFPLILELGQQVYYLFFR